MFYYYGRKKKISNKYELSKKDTIIEPFAGSAAYSLRTENISKNVILFEKSKRVYDLYDPSKKTQKSLASVMNLTFRGVLNI
jgi:site-specific DNA-adenine methylase